MSDRDLRDAERRFQLGELDALGLQRVRCRNGKHGVRFFRKKLVINGKTVFYQKEYYCAFCKEVVQEGVSAVGGDVNIVDFTT